MLGYNATETVILSTPDGKRTNILEEPATDGLCQSITPLNEQIHNYARIIPNTQEAGYRK